jgi:hypothetical protein
MVVELVVYCSRSGGTSFISRLLICSFSLWPVLLVMFSKMAHEQTNLEAILEVLIRRKFGT